jgi:hypothetical protein
MGKKEVQRAGRPQRRAGLVVATSDAAVPWRPRKLRGALIASPAGPPLRRQGGAGKAKKASAASFDTEPEALGPFGLKVGMVRPAQAALSCSTPRAAPCHARDLF